MDKIFDPLKFKNLEVKNRIFRSNIAGRLDNYDGSGNQARINWELKFARGGVGAIISSFVPISIRGRIVPNFSTIHYYKLSVDRRRVTRLVRQSNRKAATTVPQWPLVNRSAAPSLPVHFALVRRVHSVTTASR